jgi:hypothetical protein
MSVCVCVKGGLTSRSEKGEPGILFSASKYTDASIA